jgi:ferredoxin
VTLRIVVDRDLCEANGVCVRNAPGVFRVGDDDVLVVLADRPSDDQLPSVRDAVRLCPRGALSLRPDNG